MRQGITILLAAQFSWMLMLPLFAPSTAMALPACCRKNGKHHCSMLMQPADAAGAALAAIGERCPCRVRSVTAIQTRLYTPATSQAVFAGLLQHPAVSPQTDVIYRISCDRSRQKRGPPLFLS